MTIYYSNELFHHGVNGQKWGVRRYQNEDGSLTQEGREHYGYGETRKKFNNATSKYNKVKDSTHFFDRERKAAKAKYKEAKKEYRKTNRIMDKDISRSKKELEEKWEKSPNHKYAYEQAKTLSSIYDTRDRMYKEKFGEDADNLFTSMNKASKTIADNNLERLTNERDTYVSKELIKKYGEQNISTYNSREARSELNALLVFYGTTIVAGGIASTIISKK